MVAREQLQVDLTMDSSEWAERIKCRLVALGFAYPSPHVLSEVMTRVGYAQHRPPPRELRRWV